MAHPLKNFYQFERDEFKRFMDAGGKFTDDQIKAAREYFELSTHINDDANQKYHLNLDYSQYPAGLIDRMGLTGLRLLHHYEEDRLNARQDPSTSPEAVKARPLDERDSAIPKALGDIQRLVKVEITFSADGASLPTGEKITAEEIKAARKYVLQTDYKDATPEEISRKKLNPEPEADLLAKMGSNLLLLGLYEAHESELRASPSWQRPDPKHRMEYPFYADPQIIEAITRMYEIKHPENGEVGVLREDGFNKKPPAKVEDQNKAAPAPVPAR